MKKGLNEFIQIGLRPELIKWIDTNYPLVPRSALLRSIITNWAEEEGYQPE